MPKCRLHYNVVYHGPVYKTLNKSRPLSLVLRQYCLRKLSINFCSSFKGFHVKIVRANALSLTRSDLELFLVQQKAWNF
jgi:hypothetical protein